MSVICTDKTGTLTLNEMVVRSLVLRRDAPAAHVSGDGLRPRAVGVRRCRAARRGGRFAISAVLCGDAVLRREDGVWTVEGDPMEGALLAFAGKLGLDPAELRRTRRRLDDIPFDAAHKFMATLNAVEGGTEVHVKGAPDRLLDLCTHEAGEAGPEPIDRDAWEARLGEMAAGGQRVLAFATRRWAARRGLEIEDLEGLTLLGLAGFIDPPRPEAIRRSPIAAGPGSTSR